MEIERKYLVKKEELISLIKSNSCEIKELHQAYISVDDTEVRIRKVVNNYGISKCYMTIKSKGDLLREEVEFKIPADKFDALIAGKMYKGNIISKFRYTIPLMEETAEVDIYTDELLGLVTAEVEFESIEDAEKFRKPSWFGEEVTNDKKYKNKNLAMEPYCVK